LGHTKKRISHEITLSSAKRNRASRAVRWGLVYAVIVTLYVANTRERPLE
jgi:hypothetical protein